VDLAPVRRLTAKESGRCVVAEQRSRSGHKQSRRGACPQVQLAFAVNEHTAGDAHETTLTDQGVKAVSAQVTTEVDHSVGAVQTWRWSVHVTTVTHGPTDDWPLTDFWG
jgi:hypothetical protein